MGRRSRRRKEGCIKAAASDGSQCVQLHTYLQALLPAGVFIQAAASDDSHRVRVPLWHVVHSHQSACTCEVLELFSKAQLCHRIATEAEKQSRSHTATSAVC